MQGIGNGHVWAGSSEAAPTALLGAGHRRARARRLDGNSVLLWRERSGFLTLRAKASPIASMAVVDADGARPSGQASSTAPILMTISACFATGDSLWPTKAISRQPIARLGSRAVTSSDAPELDKANTTSCLLMILIAVSGFCWVEELCGGAG